MTIHESQPGLGQLITEEVNLHSIVARALVLATIAVLPLIAAAQSPVVRWAVSSYGPQNSEAMVGCGGCASDQRSMAVDVAGNVIIVGHAMGTDRRYRWKTVKLDAATGAEVWQSSLESRTDGPDQAWAIAIDAFGDVIVAGYAWNGHCTDIKIVKYAGGSGALIWERAIPSLLTGNAFGIAIGVDVSSSVIIAGSVWNGSNDDMITVKLAGTTGKTLWEKTFAGAANGNEYVFALALDPSGNPVVTGESQNATGAYEWKTMKYDAVDGQLLWQATHRGSNVGDSVPYSIAVDGAGDAIVVGTSHNGENLDMKAIKYSGSSGAVLWQKTLSGAAAGDDIAYSVALDFEGNAFVSGFSFNGSGNEWNTAKYRAHDGALVWQQTFSLPGAGGSNLAPAVTVDSFGNAIVAGRISNGSDRDMSAIKYSSMDGALLWQYTYIGSGAGRDRAAAVASVPGTVFLAGESAEAGQPVGWRIISIEAGGGNPHGGGDNSSGG